MKRKTAGKPNVCTSMIISEILLGKGICAGRVYAHAKSENPPAARPGRLRSTGPAWWGRVSLAAAPG